jgi:type IV pilus assembly protein PilB
VVSDEQVAQTVAVNAGMEYVDLNGFEPHSGLRALISLDVALKYKIAPLGTNGTALQIVIADPFDFETLDALPHVLQPELEFFCSTPSLIKTLQANLYGNEAVMGTPKAKNMDGTVTDDDAPVIRLVTNMLMEAFRTRRLTFMWSRWRRTFASATAWTVCSWMWSIIRSACTPPSSAASRS